MEEGHAKGIDNPFPLLFSFPSFPIFLFSSLTNFFTEDVELSLAAEEVLVEDLEEDVEDADVEDEVVAEEVAEDKCMFATGIPPFSHPLSSFSSSS